MSSKDNAIMRYWYLNKNIMNKHTFRGGRTYEGTYKQKKGGRCIRTNKQTNKQTNKHTFMRGRTYEQTDTLLGGDVHTDEQTN